jgi:hypothetical protein
MLFSNIDLAGPPGQDTQKYAYAKAVREFNVR